MCSICLCWGHSRLAVLRSRARSRDTSVSCFAPSLFLRLGSCFCAIPFCCLLCCIKDGLISGAVPSKHSGDPRNFMSPQRLYLHFPSFSECSHFHRNMSLPPNYSPVSPLFFPRIYRLWVCLLVLRQRNKPQGETKHHAWQFCSAAAALSLFCQSWKRLLLPFYNVWSQVHSCFPKHFELLCRCYCKTPFPLNPSAHNPMPERPLLLMPPLSLFAPRAPGPPAALLPPPRPCPPPSPATSGWSFPTSLPSPPPRNPPPRARASRLPSRSLLLAPWSRSRSRPPTPRPPRPAARPSTCRWGRRSPALTTSLPALSPHTTAAWGPASPTRPRRPARPAPRSTARHSSPVGPTMGTPHRQPGPRSPAMATRRSRAGTRTRTTVGTGGGTAPKRPTCRRAHGRSSRRILLVTPWVKLLPGCTSHLVRRRPTSPTRGWPRSRCSKR